MHRAAQFVLYLVLLSATGTAPAASQKPDCAHVRGQAQGQAISQDMFRVVVSGTLVATSTTTLLEPAADVVFQKVLAGETIRATTSHVFEISASPNGTCEADETCFTTLDRAVLSPTGTPGLYRLNSQLVIVEGQGEAANTCGRLVAHGFINFFAPVPTVEWRYSGRICDCS